MNFNSFIAILRMFGSGNNHFRISISNLKQRRAFSLKCFLHGNVVADLNIKLLATSLSNKVDFLLIELANINIISTAKKLDANDVFIYSAIIYISASEYCISNNSFLMLNYQIFKESSASTHICIVPSRYVLLVIGLIAMLGQA